MAEVKNVVPNFDEFSKDPEKYMSQMNTQAVGPQPTEGGTQPAAQPGETDSILGAQTSQPAAEPAAQPAAETPPAETAPAAQAGGVEPGAGEEKPKEGLV